MHIFTFSRHSKRLLHYGLYIIICHATAILFLATAFEASTPVFLYHRFFPMIEHSLVSFVALLFGVLGIEYIEKQKNTD